LLMFLGESNQHPEVAKLKGHTVIGSAGGAANPTTI